LAALTVTLPTMTISDEERTFFAGLGERLAQLRKASGIAQMQRRLKRISALAKSTQRAVMDVIEALLAQQGR